MEFVRQIENCIPDTSAEEIPWDRLDRLFAPCCFPDMKKTQQNPLFHGEGDVYTHTQMVCRELLGNPAFFMLPKRQKTAMFLSSLLHDLGKVKTTRPENGSWVSPHHGPAGSQMARTFLWQDCGIGGTREMIILRETVCALIHCHMLPFHLIDRDNPERKARETAAIGTLAEDFSWNLLCMLAEADIRGRIADDIDEGLAQVNLARMMAEDAGCLHRPYAFPDTFTGYAFLTGRNVQADQPLYDNTWGEIIMLSGLPGTGKDTWIRQHHPDLPMISPDGIRSEMGIKPTDKQGGVIQEARERAKALLRKKEPFVWNATDLTRDIRQKSVRLFTQYGAKIRIVYLETAPEIRKVRNAERVSAVPETAVSRMLEKAVPPMPDEAHTVEWICV